MSVGLSFIWGWYSITSVAQGRARIGTYKMAEHEAVEEILLLISLRIRNWQQIVVFSMKGSPSY
jgi:hypothetical protein